MSAQSNNNNNNGLDEILMLPTLSSNLQRHYGGPHTQYASSCTYIHHSGTVVPCDVVMTCTQMYLCDEDSFVTRVVALDKLLAVYIRNLKPLGPSASSAAAMAQPRQEAEQELLLVCDKEHDLLLRGRLVCSGNPPKSLVATLLALHKVLCPSTPIAVHNDCNVPLREAAQLTPSPHYVAPLPMVEDHYERCPCWRPSDVLSISDEEFRRRVRNMCIVYAPDKLASVADVCASNSRKGAVLQQLVEKYGPEPTEEHAEAVQRILMREEHFAELLKSSNAPLAPSSRTALHEGPTSRRLADVLRAQKKAQKAKDAFFQSGGMPSTSLMYPLLTLARQPSGGHGRLIVRIRPVVNIPVSQESAGAYIRRPRDPEHELWYLTNEGYVLPFEISDEVLLPLFGFKHGDRVLATWGATRGRWSTIVGVREGTLWVHDDGEFGACALFGFTCREELERCNGWIRQSTAVGQMRLPAVEQLRILTFPSLAPTWILIAPEVVYPRCGFHHGEIVRCADPSSAEVSFHGVAVIAGVDAVDRTTVYAYFIDPDDEGITQEALFAKELRRIQSEKDESTRRDLLSAASPSTAFVAPADTPLTAMSAPNEFNREEVLQSLLQRPQTDLDERRAATDGDGAEAAGSSSQLTDGEVLRAVRSAILRHKDPPAGAARLLASRVAAHPLTCSNPDDVKRVYQWELFGAARIVQHQPDRQQSGGTFPTSTPAVLFS